MRRLIALAALCLFPTNLHAFDVILDANMAYSEGLYIRGLTNLPDQTKIRILVHNEASNYHRRADIVVKDGKLETGPFDNGGEPLPPGTYTSEIFTEPAQFQPASVQRVIGDRGEELQGRLVRRGTLGGRVYCKAGFTML